MLIITRNTSYIMPLFFKRKTSKRKEERQNARQIERDERERETKGKKENE